MTNNPLLIQLAETLIAMSLADRETVLDLVDGPDSPLRREYKVVIASREAIIENKAVLGAVIYALKDTMQISRENAECIVVRGEAPEGNRMTYSQAHANAKAINNLWKTYRAWYGQKCTPGFVPATVEVCE